MVRNVRVMAGLGALSIPLLWALTWIGKADAESETADAIITYHRPPPTFGAPAEETWYKHGDNFRIDIHPSDGRDVVVQQFTHPGQKSRFGIVRSSDGSWQNLSVSVDALSALPPRATRMFTGATENHLGEHCRVWQVNHHTPRVDFLQSGCVTAKGIELWWRQANLGAIFATSIDYKPVAPREVRVPVEALDINAWMPLNAPADHRGDYQVNLSVSNSRRGELWQTRSGPWESTMTPEEGRFYLINKTGGISMTFVDGGKGERMLTITRKAKVPPETMLPKNRVRLADRADGMILGNSCQWWDLMPNVNDAGSLACSTADGIPLAIVTSFQAFSVTITAKRLQRSPQPISAIAPDSQIQNPRLWGFR